MYIYVYICIYAHTHTAYSIVIPLSMTAKCQSFLIASRATKENILTAQNNFL